MLDPIRQSASPGIVATIAARQPLRWAVTNDALAPLVGEISAPVEPRVRRFRDLLRTSCGRILARLLIKLLIITPLPQPMQQLALLFPISILAPFVGPEKVDSTATVETSSSKVSTRPSECLSGSRKPNRALAILLASGHFIFPPSTTSPNYAELSRYAGVNTAALGQMTYIKKARGVPIAKNGKSIETQKVSSRAIFPADLRGRDFRSAGPGRPPHPGCTRCEWRG